MRNLDEPSSIPTEQPSPCCCTPTEVASPAQPDKQEEISPTVPFTPRGLSTEHRSPSRTGKEESMNGNQQGTQHYDIAK
eukprot:5710075-Pyramimonas_sp.AAC.1